MLTKKRTFAIIAIFGLCLLTGMSLLDYNVPEVGTPLIVIGAMGMILFSMGLCLSIFAPFTCDHCANEISCICENCDAKDSD